VCVRFVSSVFDRNQITIPPKSINVVRRAEGENAMIDGFSRPVAIALAMAFATALSLLAAFAFGGSLCPEQLAKPVGNKAAICGANQEKAWHRGFFL